MVNDVVDRAIGADFLHFLSCIVPPDDPLIVHIERDMAGRQTLQDVELRVTANGRERWWSLTGKPTFDEAGVYLGYIGTGSDVTKRKATGQRTTMAAS